MTDTPSPDAPPLRLAIDPRGVARVTLDRPRVRNAFDERMIATLRATFESLDAEPAARVVVLDATGPMFCAGADIGWMQRAARNDVDANLADARVFAAMMDAVDRCRKPVVARVQGAAFGGGVGLVCAADIAIASDDARFSVSEAKLGILPAVIGPYLVNAVGVRQARRLALGGELVDAAQALAIGLVHRVVAPAALDEAVERCVDELLRAGPCAQAEIQALFSQLAPGPVTAEVRELTAQTIARVRATDEARAGFDAFAAKKPAPWIREPR